MIRLFVILLSLTISGAAQESEKKAAPQQQHNFLFVIDSSLSMAPRKTNTIQMVRQMILSGFEKQIQPGDSIDIWVYDEENHITAFPPQIWEDVEAKRIALTAARFIEEQKFKGRSRFETVARDLEALLPNTKQLLIAILTDADEPLSGIPLDLDINEFLAKEKRRRPNARQPFLISMAAVNGKYKQWAAYCDEADHVLANLPPRPKPAPVVVAKAKEPEKKKEPEKQPIAFDLPPGTRLALPKTEVVVSKPAPPPVQEKAPEPVKAALAPETNLVAVVAPKATNTPVATAPKVENTSSNSAAIVAKTSTEPPPSKPQASSKTEQPVDLAAVSKPLPIEEKPQPQAAVTPVSAKPAEIPPTLAQSGPKDPSPAFREPIEQEGRVQRVHHSVTEAIISPMLLYTGVVFVGFGAVALGGLLLLRRAKARQGGSIISKSLLQ